MSLFGALTSGVSGTKASSTAISVIADNVSNVNTVGYKRSSVDFSTLVTSSSSASTHSPGGVTVTAAQEVDQQGLIESTGKATDAAISGDGFYVVNTEADGSGEFFYTRSGSFSVDDRGNFVNASGFYLMAWPVDSQGRIPGEIGNLNTTSSALLTSLESVNINAISGIAADTKNVKTGLNLDASQTVVQGAGDTVDIETASIENRDNGADDIIIPRPTASGGTTIVADDGITVTTAGTSYTFTYGGFVQGNDISAANILGAGTPSQLFSSGTNGDTFTITTNSLGTVTFKFAATNPTAANGEFRNLDGLATAISEVNGLTARVENNRIYISPNDATEAMTFANGNAPTLVSNDVTASPVLGAATAAANFSSAINNDGMSITVDGTVYTFTYGAANDFTTLNGLATAITNAGGGGILTGAVAGGVLTITPVVGNVTAISNTGGGGSNFATALGFQGTDFLTALGLTDTTAALNRFSTLGGLRDLINDTADVGAVLEDPTFASTMKIFASDPLGQISYANFEDGAGDTSDFLTEFGLDGVTLFGPAYDASGVDAENMASGNVTPHFSRNLQIFDALGTGHDFSMSFLKIGTNTWSVEIYDIANAINTTRDDGLVANGTVVFNGDGSLRSISNGLTQAINISWKNGATANQIAFDWGTPGQVSGTVGATAVGLTDGLKQFDSTYNVEFVEQDGVAAGQLNGVNMNEDGFVIANFSNGETKDIYRIALADFANVNGLIAQSNNVYSESQASGNFNLKRAGDGDIGKLAPESVELANVDISDELARLIRAQRSYQANAKIITTSDELLEELNRAF